MSKTRKKCKWRTVERHAFKNGRDFGKAIILSEVGARNRADQFKFQVLWSYLRLASERVNTLNGTARERSGEKDEAKGPTTDSKRG